MAITMTPTMGGYAVSDSDTGKLLSLKVPVAKIQTDQIVLYNSSEYGHNQRFKRESILEKHREDWTAEEDTFITKTNNLLQNRENDLNDESKYNGYMSTATKRRVKKQLDIWFDSVYTNRDRQAAKYNYKKAPFITFLTCTLSSDQIHSDNEIKRDILGRFLNYLQEKELTRNYVWKAEAQLNGNIHFHIFLDRWIDKTVIKELWNKFQNRLGYIDRYQEENKTLKQPPSTRIDALKDRSTAIKYLMKYFVKKDATKERIIEGRIHGRSKEIGLLKPYIEYCQDEHFQRMLDYGIRTEQIKKVWEHEEIFVEVYTGDMKKLMNQFPIVKERYEYHLVQQLFHDEREVITPTISNSYESLIPYVEEYVQTRLYGD